MGINRDHVIKQLTKLNHAGELSHNGTFTTSTVDSKARFNAAKKLLDEGKVLGEIKHGRVNSGNYGNPAFGRGTWRDGYSYLEISIQLKQEDKERLLTGKTITL